MLTETNELKMNLNKLSIFELKQLKDIVSESIFELSNVREINLIDKVDISDINQKLNFFTNLLKVIKANIYEKLLQTKID